MEKEQKIEMHGFTKYEVARILGARALQIAMDAPLLIKVDKDRLESVRYDPLKIAEIEFVSGVLPISVNRPMPRKIEARLKREDEKRKEPKKEDDKKIEEKEVKEEKVIKEEGEIMEMATPEDEIEEDAGTEEAEI